MGLPVVLCIGALSVTGDRLGPMVGDLLRTRYDVPAFVYGGSDFPVTGVNFGQYCAHIRRLHPGSLVFAVDASVGAPCDVGKVKYTLGGVRAGGALKKRLGSVGDVGILGVVAGRGADNLKQLMETPYSRVEALAATIAADLSVLLGLLAGTSRAPAGGPCAPAAAAFSLKAAASPQIHLPPTKETDNSVANGEEL